jgi:hypothetical protein
MTRPAVAQAVPVSARPLSRAARAVLVVEAVFPVVAQQAYIWSVPHERPRWWDVGFGVAVTLITIGYVVRRGLISRAIFGVARWRDQWRAAGPLLAFTIVVAAGLLLWGHSHGGIRQNADVWRALLLYPLWGFVQQGLMFGVAYPRWRLVLGERPDEVLTRATPAHGREVGAGVLTALLFGLAHAPNPFLMLGGAGMVLFFALVWRKAPSLPGVAISHGLLGAICDKALNVSMRVGAHFLAA